jgi:hypothetical protein
MKTSLLASHHSLTPSLLKTLKYSMMRKSTNQVSLVCHSQIQDPCSTISSPWTVWNPSQHCATQLSQHHVHIHIPHSQASHQLLLSTPPPPSSSCDPLYLSNLPQNPTPTYAFRLSQFRHVPRRPLSRYTTAHQSSSSGHSDAGTCPVPRVRRTS